MKIGDTIESAAWLTGTETAALVRDHESRVREAIGVLCRNEGFVHGPVRFIEKRPGDERVPDVPNHVSGPDVRLLIAEADVVREAPKIETRSFLGELDRRDLERLRDIVRRRYASVHPGERLTDLEADDVIEELGPEAALDALRSQVAAN